MARPFEMLNIQKWNQFILNSELCWYWRVCERVCICSSDFFLSTLVFHSIFCYIFSPLIHVWMKYVIMNPVLAPENYVATIINQFMCFEWCLVAKRVLKSTYVCMPIVCVYINIIGRKLKPSHIHFKWSAGGKCAYMNSIDKYCGPVSV